MKYFKRIKGSTTNNLKINHIYEVLEVNEIGNTLKIDKLYYKLNYFIEVDQKDYEIYCYIIKLVKYHNDLNLELDHANISKYIQYLPTTTYHEWINLLPNGILEDKVEFVFDKIKEYNDNISNKEIKKTVNNEITIDLIEQILLDNFDRDDIDDIIKVLKEEVSKNIKVVKTENIDKTAFAKEDIIKKFHTQSLYIKNNEIHSF